MPISMLEQELIQRSLQGDQEAMDSLFHQNWQRVYSHCLGIVHDEGIAEDLAQETFLRAFQHLGSFQGRARFSTWVWRISHNLSLNYLRKHDHDDLPLKEEIYLSQNTNDNGELIENLNFAVQMLGEKYRVVFELYEWEHLPQKEIAAMLNIPYGTVRSRLHYARKQLRNML